MLYINSNRICNSCYIFSCKKSCHHLLGRTSENEKSWNGGPARKRVQINRKFIRNNSGNMDQPIWYGLLNLYKVLHYRMTVDSTHDLCNRLYILGICRTITLQQRLSRILQLQVIRAYELILKSNNLLSPYFHFKIMLD